MYKKVKKWIKGRHQTGKGETKTFGAVTVAYSQHNGTHTFMIDYDGINVGKMVYSSYLSEYGDDRDYELWNAHAAADVLIDHIEAAHKYGVKLMKQNISDAQGDIQRYKTKLKHLKKWRKRAI